jgi:hypothetical protein
VKFTERFLLYTIKGNDTEYRVYDIIGDSEYLLREKFEAEIAFGAYPLTGRYFGQYDEDERLLKMYDRITGKMTKVHNPMFTDGSFEATHNSHVLVMSEEFVETHLALAER